MAARNPRRYINPGPEDMSLLTLQSRHRSEGVWYGLAETDIVLRCRQHKIRDVLSNIPPFVIPYLQNARLSPVTEIGRFLIDPVLITALVERWRPETHTFHMPPGEMTITLEDVQIITGLPVDGEALMCSKKHGDWGGLCRQLLGSTPSPSEITGGKLELGFLDRLLMALPDPEDVASVERYTRAWILMLFGKLLFPSKSGSRVYLIFLTILDDLANLGRFSWASAVLAWLYRELCSATNKDARSIGGALFIVQVWAWERFPRLGRSHPMDWDNNTLRDSNGEFILAPLARRWDGVKNRVGNSTTLLRSFRSVFDMLLEDSISWTPYAPVYDRLPMFCKIGCLLWAAVVPLFCFCIIEWHQPDRCLRQYQWKARVPPPPSQDDKLHLIDFRSAGPDWPVLFANELAMWDNRANRNITSLTEYLFPTPYHGNYTDWYTRITRRWVTPEGALVQVLVSFLTRTLSSEFHFVYRPTFPNESFTFVGRRGGIHFPPLERWSANR